MSGDCIKVRCLYIGSEVTARYTAADEVHKWDPMVQRWVVRLEAQGGWAGFRHESGRVGA